MKLPHIHFIPPTPTSSSFAVSSSGSKVSLSESLRVCHFNANSLTGHIEMIRLFLSTRSPFHVIAVTETWLSEKVTSSPSLDDYLLYRRDRNRNGGGVALYIHKSLTVSVISSSDGEWSGKPGKPEYLFCEISAKGVSSIFVGVVYRPPHAPFFQGSNFINELTTHMQLLHEGYNGRL